MVQLAITSVVDAITEDVKSEVLSRRIHPDTALTETGLAEHYNVARATAKAAIERLVADKVLVRRNHKSARVVTLGPDDVRDIYNTRIYLESEVLRRLARRGSYPEASAEANAKIQELWDEGIWQITKPDMEFHTQLVASLESSRTEKIYRSLAFEVQLCMSQLQGSQKLSPAIIIAEHARILQLISEGDANAVADLLDEHLSRARELLVGQLGGQPGPEAYRPSSALLV
jgi:DNA-binding GntR family transcriptional regulator